MDKNTHIKKDIPAIPPSDYMGSLRIWVLSLKSLEYWNGKKPLYHGDVLLSLEEWQTVLERAENPEFISNNTQN